MGVLTITLALWPVSKGNGGRSSGHASAGTSWPVRRKPRSSTTRVCKRTSTFGVASTCARGKQTGVLQRCLRLFIGKANGTTCHNGPLLTNHEFHNNGVPERPGLPADDGRASGAHKVVADEFNCLSRWSDAKPADCTALRFLKVGTHEQERQFKVPSLRNVADRGPYMDAGQFATLREVLEHYNAAPEAPAGHSELKPLHLSETELRQLEAFLRSLSAPLATPTPLLGPAATQSEVATTAAEP